MYREAFRAAKPTNQLFIGLFVVFICGIAIMILSIVLGWLIYGVSPAEFGQTMQDLANPQTISLLKFYQIFQSIGVFIIPPFIIAWMFNSKPFKFLLLDKSPGFKSTIIVIAIIYFSNPLINWLTEVNSLLTFPQWLSSLENWMKSTEEQATKITEAFLATTSVWSLMVNLFMVGILPAIGEELLFRGFIQQLLKRISGNSTAAIWITAIIFSAVHLQFYGFLPRMLLGAMFGYMLEWSGTIWLPIIAHFINNATAVTGYFLIQKGLIGSDLLEKPGTSSDGSSWLVLISLLFLLPLFRTLYVERIKARDTSDDKT